MTTEMSTARLLVNRILAAGYMVSVHEGGDWAIKYSTDAGAIVKALNSTGEDRLVIRKADMSRVGTILLIWGNDPDGSELVADHSDNEAINRLV